MLPSTPFRSAAETAPLRPIQNRGLNAPSSDPARPSPGEPVLVASLVAQAVEGRRSAAWRLLVWINERPDEALAALGPCLDERFLRVCVEWLAQGTWAGKPLKVPQALRQPQVRTHLATLFAPAEGHSRPLVRQVLCTSLQDRHAAVRVLAGQLLEIWADLSTAPALVATLHDENSAVRVQAAKALGRLHQVSLCPALVEALSTHDEALAGQIQQALLPVGLQAEPALLEGASSSDPWVRWHAVHMLGALQDPRVIPTLVESLADVDQAVAWVAARALAAMGPAVVVPVLHLLIRAPTTAWLVETVAYVLRQQDHQPCWPIVAAVIHSMQHPWYRIATPLAAGHALEQLAEGVAAQGGLA